MWRIRVGMFGREERGGEGGRGGGEGGTDVVRVDWG